MTTNRTTETLVVMALTRHPDLISFREMFHRAPANYAFMDADDEAAAARGRNARLRRRVYVGGGQRIAIVPSAWQTDDEADAELRRSVEFGRRMLADGTRRFLLHARTVAGWRVAVYYSKIVGPPRWRVPRVKVFVSRGGGQVGGGWNWTCYSAGVVVKRVAK